MSQKPLDVVLVGAGAMSSTLAMLLKLLKPEWSVCMVERLGKVAEESTNGWNNAGTGHAAYCELNYTPQMPDGSINTDKAHLINEAFEKSLQFWSYLVKNQYLPEETQRFINATPHMSFVWGEDNVNFLRKRYEKMSRHHQFDDMLFSDDYAQIKDWIPLIMRERDPNIAVAATRVAYGADVNFGAVSHHMVDSLNKMDNFNLLLEHSVEGLKQDENGLWRIAIKDGENQQERILTSRFVFIGAGGASLPILQMSGIPEAEGYGGFPVSGQWLVCEAPEIVSQHNAKVYGQAELGAPPMSVPHLDSRVIDGKPLLLFGPFAGFTTKFLKQGSVFDIVNSVTLDNIFPMMSVGMDNMDLTKYLISEAMQSFDDRIDSLKKYHPFVKKENWRLAEAGQRVQIIKKDDEHGGKLEFGTEVVTSSDGTLAALLGASPGASTAVDAMLTVLCRCFADDLESDDWQRKLKLMIPSYGESLVDDADLLKKVRSDVLQRLQLI